MKHQLKIAAALLSLSFGSAHAIAITTVQINGGTTTTKSNVCTVSFDGASPFAAAGTGCPAFTYSAADGASSHVVTGYVPGQYAPPLGNTNPFLTVGGNLVDTVTITIPAGANYFGFYAGSIDSYNSITFTNASGFVTLSGDQINSYVAPGAANGASAGYFNVFTDSAFTSIQLNSSQAAFETDNHAFGTASVPEPASIALLGLGSLALVAGKRRRRARAA